MSHVRSHFFFFSHVRLRFIAIKIKSGCDIATRTLLKKKKQEFAREKPSLDLWGKLLGGGSVRFGKRGYFEYFF